jgi:hypothetical protein
MKKLILALGLVPALFSTAALAQTVPEDVSKAMWCGTAMVAAFTNAPSDATSEQLSQAQVYIDGGNKLMDDATQKYLNAGFTEEQVAKVKSDLVAEVTPVVTGDGSGAKYSFQDCETLLPNQPSAPDASSSAPATSSSAAQ